MYGLSLRIRSIRCFCSGKISYSFLFSSNVSPGDRCGGGEGDGEGERRGGCHSGGPECGQCAVGWAVREAGLRRVWTLTSGCCWDEARKSGGGNSGGETLLEREEEETGCR